MMPDLLLLRQLSELKNEGNELLFLAGTAKQVEPREHPYFKQWFDRVLAFLHGEFYGQWPHRQFLALRFGGDSDAGPLGGIAVSEINSLEDMLQSREQFTADLQRAVSLLKDTAAHLDQLERTEGPGRPTRYPQFTKPKVEPAPAAGPSTVVHMNIVASAQQALEGSGMLNTVERKRADRFLLLKEIYDRGDGDQSSGVMVYGEVDQKLGWSIARLENALNYLIGEGLTKWLGKGGLVAITHHGIVTYEGAVASPEAASQYFPPVQIITTNIGSMVNSAIQQGTSSSTQALTVTHAERESLVTILPELMAFAGTVSDGESAQLLKSAIETVRAQLSSPAPSRSIIREAGAMARSIVEKAGGALLAAKLGSLLV